MVIPVTSQRCAKHLRPAGQFLRTSCCIALCGRRLLLDLLHGMLICLLHVLMIWLVPVLVSGLLPGMHACSSVNAAEPPVTAIAVSPDEELVLVGCQSGLYSARVDQLMNSIGQDGRVSWREHSQVINVELEAIHEIMFSPDGRTIAVAGGTPGQFGIVCVLERGSGKVHQRLSDHDDVVTSVAWSEDGRQFYSAGFDGRVNCYEADETWRLLHSREVSTKPLTSLQLLHDAPSTDKSPNPEKPSEGLLIAAGLDQNIRIFDVNSPSDSPALRVLNNHTRPVLQVFTANSSQTNEPTRQLVVGSLSEDRTIRFWHPRNGRMLRFVRLSETPISAVFADTTDHAIVCDSLGTVRIIDSRTAQVQSESPTVCGRAFSCAWISARKQLLMGGRDGVIVAVSTEIGH
ncbi:MAG: hypothetical protein JNL58_23390 [Planctomyces sp.]|nr:hypothetical protein [Planctomyces sp.]